MPCLNVLYSFQIGVFPLEDNHPSDNYLYEVAVQTGFVKGSGSTADVFIILMGSLGETSPRKLKNPNRKCFNKGDTDAFLLTTPFSLGVIKEIEIWHNNGGTSPGWYCMQVQVRHFYSYHTLFRFLEFSLYDITDIYYKIDCKS